ncbi:uncharacterized protein LOC123294779 isoform X2 [Chrysoperla carnea]|nr:uncharacterized protein LOC123294779 isoform X2 [Chrysoperla carnea]
MSRPRRTRVYDANYNIGESLYRPALDRLDRKYSGRPLESPPRSTPVPENVDDRFSRAFEEMDLPSARRRAEKLISDETIFDSRGAATKRDGLKIIPSFGGDGDDDLDEEISKSLRKIRESRRKVLEDVDLEGTVSSLQTRRDMGLSDKLLDSVGINEVSARRIQNGESSLVAKSNLRKSLIMDDEFDDAPVQARWTALRDEETSGAAERAKQSRARLQDLEDEMEAISDRQAARERRGKQLRAILAECEDNNSNLSSQKSSLKSTRISARSEKKSVTF